MTSEGNRFEPGNVKWGPVTGLEPGPAELAVDPECVVLCLPASVYRALFEHAEAMAEAIDHHFNPPEDEGLGDTDDRLIEARIAYQEASK